MIVSSCVLFKSCHFPLVFFSRRFARYSTWYSVPLCCSRLYDKDISSGKGFQVYKHRLPFVNGIMGIVYGGSCFPHILVLKQYPAVVVLIVLALVLRVCRWDDR